ncbi:C2 calcium-dependent domain-containing protein 4C-like [Python bivittatus]|uniref:C2 calcium-dependent domain-containing protein 4C-like n=1 Tax=Python bivittatus TaxID=176946 RepID=A0A9F2WHM1_PYTBI|nr:C2 calcium-dependent domain-containing protein 4C-like [Python bivittatus]
MWFLEKMRASPGEAGLLAPLFLAVPPEKGQLGATAAFFPNILTPDRIPEFCIPPRLASPPPAKSPGPAFQPHRSLTEPGLQEAASPGLADRGPRPFPPHLIQVESVEELLELDPGGTNSDPRSQAALSLPHIPKAQTSYGFCMLLESPHTRRKESIFHSEALGGSLALPRSRASSCSSREPASSPVAIRQRFFSGRQGAWDSDTASSGESSPFGSPLLGRSPARPGSLFKARSQERLLCKAWKPRRLSGVARASSLSTDEGSSTDSSPGSTRRSSESLLPPAASSGACSFRPLPVFPLDLPCGLDRLGREATVLMDKGGLLRLSSEHCPENRRVRIRLISVEGLYEEASVEPRSINCCITFSLLPGKVQKQRSTVIKRSRNPIFNEDFFFVGVSEDHLRHLSVRMKALNKGGNMKRDLVLGESEVPLMQILAA